MPDSVHVHVFRSRESRVWFPLWSNDILDSIVDLSLIEIAGGDIDDCSETIWEQIEWGNETIPRAQILIVEIRNSMRFDSSCVDVR